MSQNLWSDEELIVACYIYNMDLSYSEKVARGLSYLNRNESAVKKRFANFDYYKGGTGLAKGGANAKRVWDEYTEKPLEMAFRAKTIIAHSCGGITSNSESELVAEIGIFDVKDKSYRAYAEYREKVEKVRIETLACADNKCCITGMSDPTLLTASHIKPWSICTPDEMSDVHNTLCLNTFHDKLFDRYRMTISESMEIIYDPSLVDSVPEKVYQNMIERYTKINVKDVNRPYAKYLEFHNNRFTAITGVKI